MANEDNRVPQVDIVIAEDSPTQAEKLRFLLEQQGHTVRVAPNGRVALAAVRERRPALVISDVVMPEMDGYGLCAALKSDPALEDIPVVIVTSLSGVQDIAKSLECGADHFIRKPYEPNALLARVEYILLNRELRKAGPADEGMEIYVGGRKHFIASGREQIIDLLVSTYDEAVHMNEELQAQQREIALSNRMLRMLYRIAGELNRVTTETDACEQALAGLLELPDFRGGWIWLDDGHGALRTVASSPLPAPLQDVVALGADCRCRRMVREGELGHEVALVECERLQTAAAGEQLARTHAVVPLMAGEQSLGVMNIVHDDSGFFSREDLRLLEAVGSQVALAIQRAQLYRHLEELVAKRTAALQAEVVERTRAEQKVASLNRIYAVLSGINTAIVRMHDRVELFREACRIAVELGKFRLAWIGVLDPDSQTIKPAAWVAGEGELSRSANRELSAADSALLDGRAGLIGLAVQQRSHATCNDLASAGCEIFPNDALAMGCLSKAVFPLFEDQRVTGVLALYAAQTGVFEDEMELKLLVELAGDISFALEYISKGEQLDYLAYYDALTGLPNRALFHDRVGQLLQTRREAGPGPLVAVVLINIERFKSINDTFGRHAGDALLKLVAERLVTAFSGKDRIARLGGDHFAAVVSGFDDAADVAHLLDRATGEALGRPYSIEGTDLHLTFRFGVALYPSDGLDAETLIANAETALLKARTKDESYLFYAPKMNARVSEQLSLENRLHRALERNEFVLHYQPKVSLHDGMIMGLEALIRWNDPEKGLVQPAAFIPILEETGLILETGRWVVEKALADATDWLAAGIDLPRIAVNVSAVQLRRKDSLAWLDQALAAYPAARGYLDLELTESVLMEDVEANIHTLGAIRAMGIRVAVDDFGTGYSSLSYLTRLPIDLLKIDQSFVRDVTSDRGAQAVCSGVIGLGHNLGLQVIAEGVEREEQMNHLWQLGCDEMQGYLFSRPLPADECLQLLLARKTLVLPDAATRAKRVAP